MRFDNNARMQQLDGILKPKKSSRSCKSSGLSISSKGGGESLASSKNGKKSTSEVSTAAESTLYSGGASVSRCSVSSRGSRSRRSTTKTRLQLGCKDVVILQQSWNRLKISQVSERSIGENVMFRLMENMSEQKSSGQSVTPERIESLSKLIVETIDSIVALAGPNLFEEDFESLRSIWIEENLDPCQVSKVLMNGLGASAVEDIFSDNAWEAWKSTVVPLVNSWGNLD